jgi:hypothetical protein
MDTTEMMTLEPGLHLDIPAADYHGDPCANPSLSSSIAKVILGQTPKHAWMKHPRLNPDYQPEADDKFNLGSVVHELMLGRGGGIEIIVANDFKTKEARARRDDARAAGLTPILSHQFVEAQQITTAALFALAETLGAGNFFSPKSISEAVAVWIDIGGPLCRAMIDRFSPEDGGSIWDIKTTSAGLSDAALARTIVNFGYDLSAAFYMRAARALSGSLNANASFRWVFVETEPPFEVRVIRADATTIALGDRKAACAIAKWRRCLESGVWPGYPRTIERIDYPSWCETQWLDREMEDPDFANAVLSNTVQEAKNDHRI